jgi:hypothetical protein
MQQRDAFGAFHGRGLAAVGAHMLPPQWRLGNVVTGLGYRLRARRRPAGINGPHTPDVGLRGFDHGPATFDDALAAFAPGRAASKDGLA